MKADALIQQYHLQPHPEGGFFAESYCSTMQNENGRAYAGSIYFLLDQQDISHLHIIDCEEIWYYHAGCGMQIIMISEQGSVITETLSMEHNTMVVIPKGVMFAAKNLQTDSYTFVSCVTVPKFTYSGFHMVTLPELKERISEPDDEILTLIQS